MNNRERSLVIAVAAATVLIWVAVGFKVAVLFLLTWAVVVNIISIFVSKK